MEDDPLPPVGSMCVDDCFITPQRQADRDAQEGRAGGLNGCLADCGRGAAIFMVLATLPPLVLANLC